MEVVEGSRWEAHGNANSKCVLGDDRSNTQLRCSITLISGSACQRGFTQWDFWQSRRLGSELWAFTSICPSRHHNVIPFEILIKGRDCSAVGFDGGYIQSTFHCLSLSAIRLTLQKLDSEFGRRDIGGKTGGWRTQQLSNTSSTPPTWICPCHPCWISEHALTCRGVKQRFIRLCSREKTPPAGSVMNRQCAEVKWWRKVVNFFLYFVVPSL